MMMSGKKNTNEKQLSILVYLHQTKGKKRVRNSHIYFMYSIYLFDIYLLLNNFMLSKK